MDHSSGRVGSPSTTSVPQNSPVTDDQSSVGTAGTRSVTPEPGRSIVGSVDDDTSASRSRKNLHDRRTVSTDRSDLQHPDEVELEGQLEDEEARTVLSQLESQTGSRRRSQRNSNNGSTHSSPTPGSSPDESELGTPPTGSPTPSHSTPPTGSTNVTGSKGASVSVEGVKDPDFEKRKNEFKEKLQPKLGFLDKHGKELGVTIGGAAMVLLGAALFAAFPPAGLCLYSCGVAVLSMGISKMLFAISDEPPQLPTHEKDKPKNEDEEETKPKETSSDDDYFKAIGKPVLDALAGKVDESVPSTAGLEDKDESRSTTAVTEAESTTVTSAVNPADVLAEIQAEIQAGKKPSEAFASALAGVLAANPDIDPNDESVYENLMPALNALEAALEQTRKAATPVDSGAGVKAAFASLKTNLSKASSGFLTQVSTAAGKAKDDVDLSGAARAVASSLTELINQIQTSRTSAPVSSASSTVSPPPTPSTADISSARRGVKRPVGSAYATSDSGSSSSSSSINSTASHASDRNKVRFQAFAFELEGFFRDGQASRGYNNNDKEELLEKGRAVANELSALPLVSTLTADQFYQELEKQVSEKLKPLVRKLAPTKSGGSTSS